MEDQQVQRICAAILASQAAAAQARVIGDTSADHFVKVYKETLGILKKEEVLQNAANAINRMVDPGAR